MLVGGTGQYITAVIEGWTIPEVPPNEKLRAELETFAAEQGAMALHERLRQLDPTAAANIDYRNVHGLSKEVQLKLNQHKPETVGQAARIQGITPAAISLLLVHVKRGFAASRIANAQKSA